MMQATLPKNFRASSYWETREGNIITFDNMSLRHMENSLRYMMRHGHAEHCFNVLAEYKRRRYSVPETIYLGPDAAQALYVDDVKQIIGFMFYDGVQR